MTSKRWMLVVTDLGSSTPLRHAAVEAGNWMAAIKEGRRLLGEAAAVPPGSSCQVAPDGTVTVHAPTERQTYLLYPEGSEAASRVAPPSPTSRVAPAVAPPPAASRAEPPPMPAKRERPKTIAYMPEAPVGLPPPATPAKRPRPMTMAYIPSAELPPPGLAASREIAVGSGTSPTPRPPSPPDAAAPPRPRYELVSANDVAPSDESPLHYRQRAFAVAKYTSQSEAEAIARERLRAQIAELADAPQGQLVHVAIYDHPWGDRPSRPAIVLLEWKDWRDELSVRYPLAEYASRAKAPAMVGDAARSLDLRARLAVATESFEDLAFLTSPEQALVFATRLLEELIDAPMIAGSFYDMASDALKIHSERGTAGRVGERLHRSQGLLSVAATQLDAVLNVPHPRTDPRYAAAVDSVPGVEPTCLMWVPFGHRGDLLGMLQLVSAAPGARFDADDATVALAVAKRAAAIIHELHLRRAARL